MLAEFADKINLIGTIVLFTFTGVRYRYSLETIRSFSNEYLYPTP